ncbi:MAG: hypothetical protein ACOYYS_05605 [Chloroflexota bacterium]
MDNRSMRSSRVPLLRRLWKPSLATGASGVAVALWIEEAIAFAEEILAMLALTFMAGVIYFLNLFMFKSRMPQREDKENSPLLKK